MRVFKLILIIGGLLFGVLVFMVSPFFAITDIQVSGCMTLSEDEIKNRAQDANHANLFLFNKKQAEARVMENLYIDRVTFEKKLPGTLAVTVKERRLCGYVRYLQGEFLYIDEQGRVLEVNTYYKEKHPVITGLKFKHFVLGKILDVDETAAYKTVTQYASSFEKYNMSGKVSHIDISDSANTKILVHNIEFNVGDGRNADEKIRTMIEIMDKLPNETTIRGFVDLTEIREQYVLRIIH